MKNFEGRLREIEKVVKGPPRPSVPKFSAEERDCIRKVSKRFAEKLRGTGIDIRSPEALKLLRESRREVRETGNGGSIWL